MAVSDRRYVLLRGGLALPVEPMLLALELEERGFSMRREGETLIVQPAHELTPEDRQRIRRWKHHLIAVIEYEAPSQ